VLLVVLEFVQQYQEQELFMLEAEAHMQVVAQRLLTMVVLAVAALVA
jgi:hypothetical protein